LEDIQILFNF